MQQAGYDERRINAAIADAAGLRSRLDRAAARLPRAAGDAVGYPGIRLKPDTAGVDRAPREVVALSCVIAIPAGAARLEGDLAAGSGLHYATAQGFPSGQRGRAVNPLAQPSEVRILSPASSG